MKKIAQITGLFLFAFLFSSAHADEAAIRQAIEKSMPTAKVESIKPSEIKGVSEVVIGASIYYVSEDGKYLLQGRLIDVANRTDLTEKKLGATRKAALEKMGVDNMIVFKPKIARYKVSVFTDIDCGYCRKLHSEIDQYMAEGITIQYLFFPRAGKGSDSYNKAVSVWCAKDRNAALTAAKKDQKVESKTCANPIDKQMELSEQFGAQGTPMIVTENGTVIPGYQPAKELAQALQIEKTTQ
jgi:thiol:disulfide interchange protein DsbC